MGMSDLVKTPHQGFNEETSTMLVSQKKYCPTVPRVTRLPFLNVKVGFETLCGSFGPGTASGLKTQSSETLSMVFRCQQSAPCALWS